MTTTIVEKRDKTKRKRGIKLSFKQMMHNKIVQNPLRTAQSSLEQ